MDLGLNLYDELVDVQLRLRLRLKSKSKSKIRRDIFSRLPHHPASALNSSNTTVPKRHSCSFFSHY